MFKQDDDAGFNFKKAHKLYKIALKNGTSSTLDVLKSYYNLIMYHQRIVDEVSLEKYIDSCSTLSKQIGTFHIHQIYLDEKRASIEEWQTNYHTALGLLQNSIFKIEDLKPEAYNTHKNFLTILYARIASIYQKQKNYELAIQYFEKSFGATDYLNEVTFYRSFINSQYAELMFNRGNYKKAYEKLNEASIINDQYLNPRNDDNAGFLTVRNQYKEQIDKKNAQINRQNAELAERTQEALRFRILLFVVIFICIIIVLIIRSRMKHLKHQKIEKGSQELIDVKNKELTTNTLQLIEKDEIIKKLSSYIKKNDIGTSSKSLIKSIENQSESLWDAFNKRFVSQNIGFYERLQEKVPNLSAADLKVCALIKLNFTGKEMSYLLGISLGSVHVARHRLRKKMKLERDKNLTNFINSI
ncbi:tetratricopeptide repeat protein [Seonamhaeicola marinus]|uniref:Tetratricopeptide repeat protein n=1 Tax=Seonamhaeicola marinus TaxID=1912246 RepID=A0A5D0J963_9FLAO|nr:tetratricopeptide repeat protein [Seonamhaeicola marinus]TYA92116.1 tetratricopeptide repeat protein [Seonamhaeicola marinus]